MDRLRDQMSTEKLSDRVRRMADPLERAAGREIPAIPRFASLRSARKREGR